MSRPRHIPQVIGSLLVAAALVAITIALVTAKLGPTSVAELEAREEARDQRIDAHEERIEELQELAEERRDGS
jgi:hypothetical protein